MGDRQMRLIRNYQSGESALLYVDIAAKSSFNEGVYELAKNGGYYGISKCGHYSGANVWADIAISGKDKKIEECYNKLNFNAAVNEILLISDIGNKYFQKNEPWALIKIDKEKAQKICALCINIAKNLSILIQPVLPKFSEELQKQLNLKDLFVILLFCFVVRSKLSPH